MTMQPVQFGILGAGRIAQNAFAPALRAAENATLAAVASRELRRAQAFGAPRAHGDYAALLADPDVEAVYVATHNGLHHTQVLAALAAGKHVLCEKPLGRTAEECAEMAAAAQAHQRYLVEAFMYRYDPRIRWVAEQVRAGAIGKLMTVQATFGFLLQKADDVRWNKEWGGGALFDVGCYCVNVCRYLFGQLPERVQAQAAFHAQHAVDTHVHGLLDFGTDRRGVISCFFDSHHRQHVTVIGSEGLIEMPLPFAPAREPATLSVERGGKVQTETFPATDTYRLEIEDLAQAIRDGQPPLLNTREGWRNLVVMEALLHAARTGKTVEIEAAATA
jgi:predicted dehydrogenase